MKNVNRYEYVVTTSKDQVFVLTEKEKNFLKENEDKRFVEFRVGIINPAYVDSIKPRKIDELKLRFPCKDCGNSGYAVDRTVCAVCGGTGANIPE